MTPLYPTKSAVLLEDPTITVQQAQLKAHHVDQGDSHGAVSHYLQCHPRGPQDCVDRDRTALGMHEGMYGESQKDRGDIGVGKRWRQTDRGGVWGWMVHRGVVEGWRERYIQCIS